MNLGPIRHGSRPNGSSPSAPTARPSPEGFTSGVVERTLNLVTQRSRREARARLSPLAARPCGFQGPRRGNCRLPPLRECRGSCELPAGANHPHRWVGTRSGTRTPVEAHLNSLMPDRCKAFKQMIKKVLGKKLVAHHIERKHDAQYVTLDFIEGPDDDPGRVFRLTISSTGSLSANVRILPQETLRERGPRTGHGVASR